MAAGHIDGEQGGGGWADREWRIAGMAVDSPRKEKDPPGRQSGMHRTSRQEVGLKILTNTHTLQPPPVTCKVPPPRRLPFTLNNTNILSNPSPVSNSDVVRKTFPDTWLWKLVRVGKNDRSSINVTVPDAITEFSATAFCMGDKGFALSPEASLTVSKPFFVDVALPYSMVQGETLSLNATVYNYLTQCLMVQVTLLNSTDFSVKDCQNCVKSSCVCSNQAATYNWDITVNTTGLVNLTVTAESVNSSVLCNGMTPYVPAGGRLDILQRQLLVKTRGIKKEFTENMYICLNGNIGNNDSVDSTKRLFSLTLPITSVEKSESAYVSVLGDILGTALQNLDHLITMPYGCGEQNMATMATIIYVLDYLKATRQVEATQKAKAIRYLQNGYQRQLSYKRKDGSYSAFGLDSEEGSTWLTAFVMKCFYWARGYAFIDEDVLKQGMSWLKKQQKRDGCFIRRGQLFQTVMKGRVEDDVSLSAYITAALLEAGTRLNDPVLLRALSCLKPQIFLSSNPYTMALLAYTFALAKDLKSKAILMDKLMKVSKSSGADLYWEYIPLYSGGLFSANVELSSYVLLALTTAPSSNDILKASRIVSWLIKQQNPYGGFYSTQDTVVAIQALAKYARIKFSPEDSLLVSVSKKEETLKVFKVDKTNSLLLQTAPLQDIPEQYGLLVQGTGCVYIQSVLKYNVLTVSGSSDFTISATGTCNSGPELLQLLIQFRYIGNRKVTNMVLIEVEMLSGYQLYDQTGLEIKELPLVKRVEIKQNSVIIYLEQLDQTSHQSRFLILRKHLVQDLKTANIKVYDYYQTEESAVTTYSGCS